MAATAFIQYAAVHDLGGRGTLMLDGHLLRSARVSGSLALDLFLLLPISPAP